jgi:hypothetical protein
MGNLKSFFKVRRDVLRAEGKFKATGVVYQALSKALRKKFPPECIHL